MAELFPLTLGDLLAEARRELAMRRRVYPRQVAAGRLTQSKADEYIKRQEATLRLLAGLAELRPGDEIGPVDLERIINERAER